MEMDLDFIKAQLSQEDFQFRLKAVQALHAYPAEIAVPILITQSRDREFLVRTFIAMALAKHRTDSAFQQVLEFLKFDNTPSVRAEAANSLSLFGRVSVSHLIAAFIQDDHWLVRRSILAALSDMNREMGTHSELLEACLVGLEGDDEPVRETCLAALTSLHDSPNAEAALAALLAHTQSDSWRIRQQVALGLKSFDRPQAQAALNQLRQDPDARVVAACRT